MACLDTYKSPDQKGNYPPMSPRLSFSNDFVQSPTIITNNNQDQIKIKTTSDEFEFEFEFDAVTTTNHQNQTMSAADELFFKGKLLPTIRDELLLDDDDDDNEPPKGLPKWKDFLSLKRSVDGRAHGRANNNNNNNQCKLPK